MTKPCKCSCGYTCDRQCDLDVLECLNTHYVQDCTHKWNGPVVDVPHGQSVTCSICGQSADAHDMRVGP